MPKSCSSATPWADWSLAGISRNAAAPSITRKLITLGTPWRGAGMAIDKLSNGVPIKIGPINKLNLDMFARSLPSLYQLMPEYACINSADNYLKITETSIPDLDPAQTADAMAFHIDLQQAERGRPASKPMGDMLVVSRQPTITTFSIAIGKPCRRKASAPSMTTATAPFPSPGPSATTKH